jgi:hypothetical protein
MAMMNHTGQAYFGYRVHILKDKMDSCVGGNIQQCTKNLGLIIFKRIRIKVPLLKIPFYIFEEAK